ncbi:hypothetical protein ACVBMX_14060 [Staphylococcus aureus]
MALMAGLAGFEPTSDGVKVRCLTLIRSINGETPEGAVPVEDRGPNTEADI